MSLTSRWVRFWFEKPRFENLAIFRILIGSTVFLTFLFKLTSYRLRYTPSGFLGDETLAFLAKTAPASLLPFDMKLIPIAFGAVLLFSLMLTLGIFGRISALLSLLSLAYLLQNSPVKPGHVETILPHWLLGLTLCDSCRHLSLWPSRARDTWLGKLSDDLSAAGTRVIQIQLCIIYHYAALHKLWFPPWQTGDALGLIFQWQLLPIEPFRFLSAFPVLIAAYCILVTLFEEFFAVLVWFEKSRTALLIAGVIFHIGNAIVLRVPFFSAGTLAVYVLFISPESISRFLSSFRVPGFVIPETGKVPSSSL